MRPDQRAVERAGPHVEGALEAFERRRRQVERLVVDVQANDLGVRQVDDRLALLGETVRFLSVDDRPRLVEPVDVRAAVLDGNPLVAGAPHPEVAVGGREERLGGGEALLVEARLDQAPLVDGVDVLGRLDAGCAPGHQRPVPPAVPDPAAAAPSPSVSPRSVTTTSRAGPRQRVGAAGPIDGDDQVEAAGAPRRDARDGILDDRAPRWRRPEVARRLQEGVRGRLAGQAALLRRHPVHPDAEQIAEPCRGEDRLAGPARRHDPGAHPVGHQVSDHRHRARVDLDALRGEEVAEELLLAVAQAADRLPVERIVGHAVRKVDVPGGQEAANAVVARQAVHVERVVTRQRERNGRRSRAGRPSLQEVVEHPLPRPGVERGGRGQHPVEVEENRLVRRPVDGHQAPRDGPQSIVSAAGPVFRRPALRTDRPTAGVAAPLRTTQPDTAATPTGQRTPVPPSPQ